jgi:hypothetical protein
VNDVRDKLVQMGVQDEIEFHFVKMDKDKIEACYTGDTWHTVPYGTPEFHLTHHTSRDGSESQAWERLVAVKELLISLIVIS